LTVRSKFVLKIDRSVKFDSSVKFEFKIAIFAPYLASVAGFPKGGISMYPLDTRRASEGKIDGKNGLF
jgi:hypothetical protein